MNFFAGVPKNSFCDFTQVVSSEGEVSLLFTWKIPIKRKSSIFYLIHISSSAAGEPSLMYRKVKTYLKLDENIHPTIKASRFKDNWTSFSLSGLWFVQFDRLCSDHRENQALPISGENIGNPSLLFCYCDQTYIECNSQTNYEWKRKPDQLLQVPSIIIWIRKLNSVLQPSLPISPSLAFHWNFQELTFLEPK